MNFNPINGADAYGKDISHEKNVPTQQDPQGENSRISKTNGHTGRSAGYQSAQGKGKKAPGSIAPLKLHQRRWHR